MEHRDAPKKSPKGILLAVAALVLVLALAAGWSFGLFGNDPLFPTASQGGEGGDDSGQTTDAPTEPSATDPTDPPLPTLEIKVWTPPADQDGDDSWLVKMEARFAAAHPEYEITWANEPMAEGDAAGLICGSAAAGADVYIFLNDQMNALIQANGLTRLTGEYAQQVRDDNGAFMVNSATHTDGELYSFPMSPNTWFLYYNKDVFTEEDVKSLDTMLGKGKVCLPLTPGWTAGCFFLGTGGTIFGETGNNASAGIQFGGESGYTAAKKMIELVDDDNVVCGGMDATKLTSGEVDAVFAGSWVADTLRDALGDKLGVAVLPTFTADGQEYQMKALSGARCVGVNPNAAAVEGKQELCMAFAAYLASEESQLARYELRGVTPAHEALSRNELVMSDPVAMAEIDTIRNASVLQSALPGMSRYWLPVQNFSNGVISGEITLENYAKAVDQMQEQLNAEN